MRDTIVWKPHNTQASLQSAERWKPGVSYTHRTAEQIQWRSINRSERAPRQARFPLLPRILTFILQRKPASCHCSVSRPCAGAAQRLAWMAAASRQGKPGRQARQGWAEPPEFYAGTMQRALSNHFPSSLLHGFFQCCWHPVHQLRRPQMSAITCDASQEVHPLPWNPPPAPTVRPGGRHDPSAPPGPMLQGLADAAMGP